MTPSTTIDDDSASRWWPRIETGEHRAVGWATGWFFCILMGYLVVRPVRETMGVIGGIKELQGLMLATFVVMLVAVPAYAALVARLPRRWLVRTVYHFFAACLLLFGLLMQAESPLVQSWTARVFFVWVNVFALFSTSVFWSVLADLFNSNQGKRLFGLVAAGGTAGAITGSLLTSQLAPILSTSTLLLLPIVMLECGLMCAWRLERQATRVQRSSDAMSGIVDHDLAARTDPGRATDSPTGGGLLTGITHVLRSPYLALICLFLFFVQACGTQLYFEQAEIVAVAIPDRDAKTQLFAYVDLGTQTLTILIQTLVTSVVLRRLGVSVALAVLPVVYFAGFSSLAVDQSLAVLVVTMVATRATAYGITVPSREVLFTVVSREDKYKSKSFIDTVVLRGGDALSGQIVGTLRGLGLSLGAINLWAVPVTVLWAGVAWRLGRRQRQLAITHRELDRDVG